MKLENHTILITGGSSGIGLELAKQLIARNNKVVICGRSQARLEEARRLLAEVNIFCCDISVAQERAALFSHLARHHPHCDILINNAAIVSKSDFVKDPAMIEKAEAEINTNLLAPIALAKMFLSAALNPSAIVNITTGLIYAPRAVYPIYNATKAGLHSFTQVLRYQMKDSGVKIIEVMMPVVDTPWHKGSPPKIAIPADRAVNKMIAGIASGKLEVKVGGVKILYALSRLAPGFAFRKINGIR